MPLLLSLLRKPAVLAGVTIAVLGGSLYFSRQEVKELRAVIAARPTVVEKTVTKTVTRTVQGPVRVVVRTITAPDGTKTIEKTFDRASKERTTGSDSVVARSETPACPPERRMPMRYGGVAVDPFNYARLPRLDAGLNFWNRLDAGVAWDPRRPLNDGGLGVEARWRF